MVFVMWAVSFLGPHLIGNNTEANHLTTDELSVRESGLPHFARGIMSWVSIVLVVATVYIFMQLTGRHTALLSEEEAVRLKKHFKLYSVLPVCGLLLSAARAILSLMGVLAIPDLQLADVLSSDITSNLAFLFLYAYAMCMTWQYIQKLS
jgi:hypothetical protein